MSETRRFSHEQKDVCRPVGEATRHPEESRPGGNSEGKLIAAVAREVDRRRLTHAALAARSGLPRSAVTGILSGSLQKVTVDRVLRLVEAAGLGAEVRIRAT